MYYAAMVDHSSINIKASSLRQAMRSASNAFKGLDQKMLILKSSDIRMVTIQSFVQRGR
jgi:hypothetical protein